MHILIAPNSFKHSLSATDAAEAIRCGLTDSRLPCSLECFPIGDGGDGTGALLIQKMNGKILETRATDPLQRKIKTSIGLIDDGKTAVIELADVSGLRLLSPSERDPLHASSAGMGDLIRFALDQSVNKIIMCIGGSATVDGGSGMLQSLGARFLDAQGETITHLPVQLGALDSIDLSGVDPRIFNTTCTVLCDVDNPLTGPNGAAAVFGPQKGASPAAVLSLESLLERLAAVAQRQTGIDMRGLRHGGAAGGVAAALAVFLNAKLLPGIDEFLDITGFDASLAAADLLITGEGSIDKQTLDGKGPFGVARRANRRKIPVIGLAGNIPLAPEGSLSACFDVLLAIGHGPEMVADALLHTRENLRYAGEQIGRLMTMQGIASQANK